MCASCRLISIDKCRRMRILRYTAIAGRENVVAGTDCGLGGRVHADLAWREMDSNFFVPRHESPALIAEKPICRDQQVRYDSPLEGSGFELSVPQRMGRYALPVATKRYPPILATGHSILWTRSRSPLTSGAEG